MTKSEPNLGERFKTMGAMGGGNGVCGTITHVLLKTFPVSKMSGPFGAVVSLRSNDIGAWSRALLVPAVRTQQSSAH